MVDWKPIPEFPGYLVSNAGQVKRTAGGRGARPDKVLKNSRDVQGYAVVNLYRPNNGGAVKCYVHRLVAFAFLPPQPSSKHHVAHWDGDGMNAAASNLRWVVQSENELDKRRHGRDRYAPKGSRLFSEQEIANMRSMLEAGKSLREIGRHYGRPHNTITTAIRHGAVKPH